MVSPNRMVSYRVLSGTMPLMSLMGHGFGPESYTLSDIATGHHMDGVHHFGIEHPVADNVQKAVTALAVEKQKAVEQADHMAYEMSKIMDLVGRQPRCRRSKLQSYRIGFAL